MRYNLNEFFLNQFNFKIENEEYTGLQMFFTEKDEDLIDIINTRLIKYINSFLITLNEDEDSTFEEAFLAQYSKSL